MECTSSIVDETNISADEPFEPISEGSRSTVYQTCSKLTYPLLSPQALCAMYDEALLQATFTLLRLAGPAFMAAAFAPPSRW
jgi:hypothetical protein